jgi:hypothetical protein
MTKEYVWLNWSNLNYKQHPYRHSYRQAQGVFEFPVDRFGIADGRLEIPCVNIVKEPIYNLSNITNDFEDRYYSAFDTAADNIFKTVGDRTIYVLYSGGVDSVCVLAAIQRHSMYKELLEQGRIVLSMTSQSIEEFPSLFYSHILNELPIVPLNYDTLMRDPNAFLVTGDMGDHIIGSSDIMGIVEYADYDSSRDWGTLIPYINNKTDSKEYMDLLFTAKKAAPFEIKSANQFVWWANQCYAFQDDLVKPWYWSKTTDFTEIATQNKVFRFFYDDAFVSFTYEYMSTNPKYKNYHDCKAWARQFIFNHFKDPSYLDKQKIYSQRLTMRLVEKSQIYIQDGVFHGYNVSEKL